MGSMYFSLKNNENTKKHIEKIKELIEGTTAKMQFEDYHFHSSINIENMGLESHIMSIINRDCVTGKLCLRIYNDDDRDKEVKILFKDIEVIYDLG